MSRAKMSVFNRSDHIANLYNAPSVYSKWMANANSTLKKDDFEAILEGVKELQELKLVAAMDLRNAGVVTGADIRDQVVSKQNSAGDWDADQSMNVVQLNDNQSEYGLTTTPLPITHSSFHVPYRQSGFDYKQEIGRSVSMRAIMNKHNTVITNGNPEIVVNINGANQQLYGYTNHPNRTTRTITNASSDSSNLLSDVASMVCDFRNTNKIDVDQGSIMMYYANNLCSVMKQQAFANKGSNNFKNQILDDNPELSDCKPLTPLANNSILMVVMQPEYVQLASAVAPIVSPHMQITPLDPDRFTAYLVESLLIHVDNNSLTGIVHGTTA